MKSWLEASYELEKLSDTVRPFDRMAQRTIGVDLVMVSASDLGSLHVAAFYKIGDDCLSGPLGNPNSNSYIPTADPRVACDTDQYVTVVG